MPWCIIINPCATTLHCTTLRHTTLHYTTLHYITVQEIPAVPPPPQVAWMLFLLAIQSSQNRELVAWLERTSVAPVAAQLTNAEAYQNKLRLSGEAPRPVRCTVTTLRNRLVCCVR